MNWRRGVGYILMVLLLVGLLPVLGLAQEGNVTTAANKIEAQLLEAFNAEGTADFVVQFVAQADLSAAYGMDWDARGEFVYNSLKEVAAHSQVPAKTYLDGLGLAYHTFIAGNELYVWAGNLDAAQGLAAMPEVAVVRATRTMYVDPIIEEVSSTPDSPDALAWGILDVQADQFWSSFGMQGDGIVVANIDTGVEYNHSALDQSYKCWPDPSDPACWEDPSNICPSGNMCDNNGHGTHTMGTMVGDDDPTLTWQAGMAPNAQWIACKGCESSLCSEYALNTCADWILAPGGDPANRPHIVNNSWGGGGCDSWYQAKVQAWRAAGTFPAFSAGNSSGCGSMGSPGDYQESFASTGHNSSRVHYYAQGPSCYGHEPYTKPNITAPAVSVCSSVPGNSWSCGYSGTSMASPHSAGAVALLWSCNPSLIGQIDTTFEALQDNTDPPDPPNPGCGVPPDNEGTYEDGYGYLNVYQAGMFWCGETGYLDGYVTEVGTGNPIEGAEVVAVPAKEGEAGIEAVTDPTGYYTMTLMAGTYDVTASHALYTAGTVTGVEIFVDQVTTQDFELDPKGRLHGYVTDYDSGLPLEAMVEADDGTVAYTDPGTGYYEMYLDEGTYDVVASAPDYADGTATVGIVSGEDTQQDFALMAAVAFVPTPVEVTLDWQTTDTMVATILNRMDVAYDFEFREEPGGFIPAKADQDWGEGTITWLERNTEGVPVATSDSGATIAYPGAYRYTPPNPLQFNVLVYTDDWIHTTPNTLVQQALARLSLAATVYIDGNYTGFQTALNTGGPWDLVIWSGENYQPDASLLADLLTYVQGGGKLAATYWRQLDYPVSPLWTEMGFTYISNYVVPPPAYWWDPAHPIFNNPESAPEWINRVQNSGTSQGTRLEPLASGVALAGYTTAPAPNEAGMVLRDDGMTIYKGLRDVSTNADDDSDGVLDGVELWENIMTGLLYGLGGDVPWLGEDPIAGTVPPSGTLEAPGTLDVTLLFTATYDAGVNQPGDYYATLVVNGDPQLKVPVTMTVLPPMDMGKVHGYVMDRCTGEGVEAMVDIAGGDPVTQTVTDPDTGYYAVWLVEGSYDFTFSADGYLDHVETVGVTAGQTTTVDVDLVPDRPCISVEPDMFEVWLVTGTVEYQHPTGMDITNNGGQDLEFEIREEDGGYTVTLGAESIAPTNIIEGTTGPIPGGDPSDNPPADWWQDVDAPPPAGSSPDTWGMGTPVPGGPQFGNPVATTDAVNFYLMGGLTSGGAYLNQCQHYDTGSDTWTAMASMPTARNNTHAYYNPADGKIYVPGGYLSGVYIPNFDVYDPGSNTWATLAPLPVGKCGIQGGIVDNKVYVLGGNGGSTTDNYIYDIASGTWSSGTPLPVDNRYGSDLTHEGYIYIIGGWQNNVFMRYHPATDTWEMGPALNVTRNSPTVAVSTDGIIYAWGGGADWTPLYDGEYYDLANWPGGSWTTIVGDNMPQRNIRAGYACASNLLWNEGGGPQTGAVDANQYWDGLDCYWPGVVDVPWIWEDPVSGTVPADIQATTNVDIYFTALYTDLTPMPLGTYTATLKVGNNDPVAGTPAVLALMHIVEEFVPPTAGFESNSPVCLGEEMVFTNLSVPGVPPETDYTWDFGDGQTSVEENPTHVYAAAGVYTVELEACNAGGCDTYSADVEVLPLPVAGFDYSVSVLEVTFTNLSTDADTYAWDFGDGGTSTEENPVHTYLDAGTYTVVLTATNSCGEDVYSADVEVVGRFYLYLPIVIRD